MRLGSLLAHPLHSTGNRPVLWFGERSWTSTQLDAASARVAGALAASGVRVGDRVAFFLPNCPELILAYLACFKLGAIAVPLNYRYRTAEILYALEHSGSSTLFLHASLLGQTPDLVWSDLGIPRLYRAGDVALSPPFLPFGSLLEGDPAAVPPAEFDSRQPAAILYTSGTTARPKGVVYTHGTLWENCRIITESFRFTPDDVHLVSTAACHAAALTGKLLPSFYFGSTCVLTHLPSPAEVVRLIATRGITRLQLLPASLHDLVEFLEVHPGADLRSLRICTAGGDVVPLALHDRFRKVVGFDITELYGMTEALSCITNPMYEGKRLGSIGLPTIRTEARIVDEQDRDLPTDAIGELLIRSPAMTVGYWNNPAATADLLRGGWLHTGDLARRDADGFFWFVGRKKEIIIRGGSNISPLEIEEVLDEHPAVHLSCVVGKPDPRLGEIVVAFVALRDDAADRPDADALRRFVAQRIAAYKVPEELHLVGELPLNATGKVDRRKMHEQVRGG